MIVGIGSDLIDIRRIEKTLERFPDRFEMRLFTDLRHRVEYSIGIRLVVASIPTAVIGLVFEDAFEALFATPAALVLSFGFTGTILTFTILFVTALTFTTFSFTALTFM